jgi:methanethiol S-methyltransferase
MSRLDSANLTRRRTVELVTLAYGGFAYLIFVAIFAYTIGFLANAGVPKGIDDGPSGPAWLAILVDAGLLCLFAIQHSLMARPWFKRWWTRFVPAPIERSTYVLASSLVVALLIWQWRPLPDLVWSVPDGWARALLWLVYSAGWAITLLSSFLIGHFDFLGLRQALARARRERYTEPSFRQPFLYRLVRHPLMTGFLIAFWVVPDMSQGRLLFAVAATGYIIVGVRFEERDLSRNLGEPYRSYAERVPRFFPKLTRDEPASVPATHAE